MLGVAFDEDRLLPVDGDQRVALLDVAAHLGAARCLEFLLDKGREPSSATMKAAVRGMNVEMAKRVLSRAGRDGLSLCAAIQAWNWPVVEWVLEGTHSQSRSEVEAAFVAALSAHSAKGLLALGRWSSSAAAVFGEAGTLLRSISGPFGDSIGARWTSVLLSWLGEGVKISLLYRAAEGSFAVQGFHEKCDGRGPTLTLVRTDRGSTFGGYAAVAWGQVNYYVDDPSGRSFVFVLESPNVKTPVKYNLTNARYAVYCCADYGPTFGCQALYCRPRGGGSHGDASNSYGPNLAKEVWDGSADGRFEIDTIEVWAVAMS